MGVVSFNRRKYGQRRKIRRERKKTIGRRRKEEKEQRKKRRKRRKEREAFVLEIKKQDPAREEEFPQEKIVSG